MKTLLISLLVVGLGLAGCSSGDDDDGPIRIRIWHQKDVAERELLEEVLIEYNANHPDRVVETLYKETEELRSLFVIAAAGGHGPELVFGPADNVGLYATTNTILPIDSVFDQSFLDSFTEDGIVSLDGKSWMVADQIGNHLAFVYNKALIPEPPETFSEFIELAKKLTVDEDGDGTPDRYGLTWNYTEPFFFIPFLTGFDGWVMQEDGQPTLDDPATVRAIQFILDLRDKHKIIPRESDYDVAQALFKEGRAGAIINGSWSWSSYGDAGIDYGVTRIPRIDETGKWCGPMVAQKGYSLNVNLSGRRLEIAKEVVEFLAGAEVQTKMARDLATIPVSKAALASDAIANNEILQASIYQKEVGRAMPIRPQMRQIWDGARGPYQLVMSGAISAVDGARMMQEKAKKLIADTFL